MEKISLQKYFTDCGIMSRRAAEAEIEAGKVMLKNMASGEQQLLSVEEVIALVK